MKKSLNLSICLSVLFFLTSCQTETSFSHETPWLSVKTQQEVTLGPKSEDSPKSEPQPIIHQEIHHHHYHQTVQVVEQPEERKPRTRKPSSEPRPPQKAEPPKAEPQKQVDPPKPPKPPQKKRPVVKGKPEKIGCSDGTREGFRDLEKYPDIAACAGGWSIPGVHQWEPACDRVSGNSSKNTTGEGCNVEDLCAPGFHVCTGDLEVQSISPDGCENIDLDDSEPGFYLTRESSRGHMQCSGKTDAYGADDLFGCGNLGCGVNYSQRECHVLNRASHDSCHVLEDATKCDCTYTDDKVKCKGRLGCRWCQNVNYYETLNQTDYAPSWDCGRNSRREASNVVKRTSELGGVLCCRDNDTAVPRFAVSSDSAPKAKTTSNSSQSNKQKPKRWIVKSM